MRFSSLSNSQKKIVNYDANLVENTLNTPSSVDGIEENFGISFQNFHACLLLGQCKG